MAYGIREIHVSKSEKYMFQNQRNICLKNKQIYVAQVVATSEIHNETLQLTTGLVSSSPIPGSQQFGQKTLPT